MTWTKSTSILCWLALLFTFTAPAGAQLRKVNIAYTATSPYRAVLIITRDAGLFRKHGLDVSLIFTTGGRLRPYQQFEQPEVTP